MSENPRPTQADVARLAGVSVATVSYVISGRATRSKPASPQTVKRVREAMDQLGYRPQLLARALRRQRSGLIAILTYAPSNPWTDDLMDQVQARCSKRGLETIVLPYNDNVRLERQIKLIRGGVADAVLLLGMEDMFDEFKAAIAELPVPVLAVANDGPPSLSLIRQREDRAIGELLDHLVKFGIRQVHYLTERGVPWKVPHVLRTEWLIGAVTDRGLPPPVIHEFPARHPSLELTHQLFDAVPLDGTAAIVCNSDRAAITLLWGAVREGIRVPDEVRITGMGNVMEGTFAVPPLTTLGVPRTDYSEAIDHLLDRIDDRELGPRQLDLHWSLIARGSG